MLVKHINYIDFNGNQREEDAYFNLTDAELSEWLVENNGGQIEEIMKELIRTDNMAEVLRLFKSLIYKSYGKKTPDGRRFMKSKEILDDFVETEAYSQLFMDLVSDPKKFAEFFAAILPKEYGQNVLEFTKDPAKMPGNLGNYIPKPVESTPTPAPAPMPVSAPTPAPTPTPVAPVETKIVDIPTVQ